MRTDTEVSEVESAQCIRELAQAEPFVFVDRVVRLDDTSVVTELHGRGLPERFADAEQAQTYALLEFAAQSSGLLLRGRKKQNGGRSVISLFRAVERKSEAPLRFPLTLESRLADERWSFFEFEFAVRSGTDIVFGGNVSIHLRS